MARPSETPITANDLKRYVQSYSDFAFELSVLKILTDAHYSCLHSGTYDDPVTGKTRQFDIQAQIDVPTRGAVPVYLRLAVECKNVKPHYPLVLHRVVRTRTEAFIDTVYSTKPRYRPFGSPRYRCGERVRLRDGGSPYRISDYVAKAADQVGKRADGELQAADHDVFDRINQAAHSAHELLERSHYAGLDIGEPVVSVVMPVLVVPDKRLWAVDYNENGGIVSGPDQIDHAIYFLDGEWAFGTGPNKEWYSLSHLEIVAIGTLGSFVKRLIKNNADTAEKVHAARTEEAARLRKSK